MSPFDAANTRRSILEAAFEEIRVHGFQAASLNRILANTNVTKGALYHHFPGKKALGYAVVDELIGEMVRRKWIDPLAHGDPIDAMLRALHEEGCEIAHEKTITGCPLNNLAQEIASLDPGFRERITRIYTLWRTGIGDALRRGQREHRVREDVDTNAAATFIVAAMEGCIGMAKSGNDINLLYECGTGLMHYLETLRAPGAGGSKSAPKRASQRQKRR